MKCSTVVNSSVCVEANVKINADVKVGEVNSRLIGCPCIRRCRNCDNKCVYMVCQNMRVCFPLIYSTNVTSHVNGVGCGCVDAGKESCDSCQDNRRCCDNSIVCMRDEACNCCQRTNVRKRVRRNRFLCPLTIFAAMVCRGRGIYY